MPDKKKAEEKTDEGEERKSYAEVSGPIGGWMAVLFVVLIIEVFLSPITTFPLFQLVARIAALILFLPGSLILPLVVGAAIGAEVGLNARSIASAVKGGLLNSMYAVLVYFIAIFIIYEILAAVSPTLLSQQVTRSFLLDDWIVFPAVITIVLAEVFAVMSYSRKMKA